MSVKTDLKIETNHVLVVAGAGILGYLLWRGYQRAGQIAAGAVEKVNPASPNNFIYQGVSAVGSSITGDKNWNLGGWLYDITHREVQPQVINTAVAQGDRLIKLDNNERISE